MWLSPQDYYAYEHKQDKVKLRNEWTEYISILNNAQQNIANSREGSGWNYKWLWECRVLDGIKPRNTQTLP